MPIMEEKKKKQKKRRARKRYEPKNRKRETDLYVGPKQYRMFSREDIERLRKNLGG